MITNNLPIGEILLKSPEEDLVCLIRRTKIDGTYFFDVGESVTSHDEIINALTAGLKSTLSEALDRDLAEIVLLESVEDIQKHLDETMGKSTEDLLSAKIKMLDLMADTDAVDRLAPQIAERYRNGLRYDDLKIGESNIDFTTAIMKAKEIVYKEKEESDLKFIQSLKESEEKIRDMESLIKRVKEKSEKEMKAKDKQIKDLSKEINQLEHRLIEMEKANTLHQ